MQYFRAQSCAYDNDVTQPKTPLADFTSPTISTRLELFYTIEFIRRLYNCEQWNFCVTIVFIPVLIPKKFPPLQFVDIAK